MRPMLASKAPDVIQFPLYASPKVDGIRAIVKDGILLSRTLKPIPNTWTQDCFGHDLLNGLDGELAVGTPTHPNLMQITTSGVMSEQGTPPVTLWVFDIWYSPAPYVERLRQLQMWFAKPNVPPHIGLLMQKWIENQEQLEAFEAEMLQCGFEGIMLRKPDSPYKFGRSTAKEGYLLKLKRFQTDEGIVVGFEEQMANQNEATTDNLGLTHRSSHKSNLVPAGIMGTMLLKDIKTGGPVRVGTGFTTSQRKEIWENKHLFLGLPVTYRHFSQTGVKDARRISSFVAFRHPNDMSPSRSN